MIHPTRRGAFVASLALLCSLVVVAPAAMAQCTNSSQYGSATIATNGSVVTISTCSYAGEYSPIYGAVAGMTLRFTSSGTANYITIHSGTYNGPVIANGFTPLVFANTYTGTLFAHWNIGSGCGTDFSCHTTTVQCTSCTPPPAPPNNNACNAIPITCGTSGTGTNVGAVRLTGWIDSDGPGGSAGYAATLWAFVWYKFTATADGCATFSMCDPLTALPYGIVLVLPDIYGPAPPPYCVTVPPFATYFGAFNCPGTTFGATVDFPVAAGTTYYLAIRSLNDQTQQGSFRWSLTCVPPPSNDKPCFAQELLPGVPQPFNNGCASADAGEAAPAGGNCNGPHSWCNGATGVENSLWYRFIAPPSGAVSIGTNASGWDGQLAVYQVQDCGDYSTYVNLWADDDSGPGFEPLIQLAGCLVPGQEYLVQSDGYFGDTGSGTITMTALPGEILAVDLGLCQTRIIDDLDDNFDQNYLLATSTGGQGGVRYEWSVASGDPNSIEVVDRNNAAVRPWETSVYCVTATDSIGCEATDCVEVQVISAICGNKGDKITICHNENNPHEICIDPCGAEAHLGGHDFDVAGPCVLACNARNPAFPPPPPCVDLTIDIQSDWFGGEVGWVLTQDGGEIASMPYNTWPNTIPPPPPGHWEFCVDPRSCYEFTITDAFGDGICYLGGVYGCGFYTVTYDGAIVASGGDYGSGESTEFGACGAPPPAKSGAKAKLMPEVSVAGGRIRDQRVVDVALAPRAADPSVRVELWDGQAATVLFEGAVEAGETYRSRGLLEPATTGLAPTLTDVMLRVTSSTGSIEHKTSLLKLVETELEDLPEFTGSQPTGRDGLHSVADPAEEKPILRRHR